MNQVTSKAKTLSSKLSGLLRFDFQLIWNVIVRPSQTLQYARFSEYFHSRHIVRHFVLPMSLLTSAVYFIGAFLTFGKVNIESVVLNSLFTFIVMMMTFYAIGAFVGWYSRRYVADLPKWNAEALAAADMAVIFAVNILYGLFPSMFFIRFFYAYILYVVWAASDTIVPIPERNKNRYMIIVTATSILVPIVLYRLLSLLAPNI